MNRTQRDIPAAGPLDEAVVDAFFDRELDEGSRERLFGELRGDLPRCEQVARTQRAIALLREPVDAPDVTHSVLQRVGARRGFLSPAWRGLVKSGRLAVAAGVLLALLAIAVAERMSPGVTQWSPVARPVAAVVEQGRQDAASCVEQMASAAGAVTRTAAPVMEGLELAMTVTQERTGPTVKARHVYLVGRLSPGPITSIHGVNSARGTRMLVFGGAGPDVSHAIEAAPADGSYAGLFLPLGHVPASRPGLAWAGASACDYLFVLPPTEARASLFPSLKGLVPDWATEPLPE